MANTTFTGPVRSENGFKTIVKSATTGANTNEMTFSQYTATVTVADGATTGKEASIGMPANFIPMAVMINVTTAATNAVNLNDIGDDGDTDSYLDGAAVAVNSTGFKGVFGCNGVRGLGTGTGGATTTADEVEVVVSGDPGASGVTMVLKFIGISSSSDAS